MTNTAKLAAMEALYAQLPKIECQRKCQDCCGPIMMTRLEARRLPELKCDTTPLKIGMGFYSRTPTTTLVCPCSRMVSARCTTDDRHFTCTEWNFPLAGGGLVNLKQIFCSKNCLELWKRDAPPAVAHQQEVK